MNQKVKRTINYYELDFKFETTFNPQDGDQFKMFFSIITSLAKTRAAIRYQKFGEKLIFFQDLKFEANGRLIVGKIRCIRKDVFPEIMNTKTDVAKGIDAAEEEGLVETTHFVIDQSKKTKKLALEHNQFGAKITDFINYVIGIGKDKKILRTAGSRPLVHNELKEYKNRINRCSEFVVKVHKDNVEKLKSVDTGLYSALQSASDQFKSEYATLILKFNYRKKLETEEISRSISNIIDKLIQKPNNVHLFNTLSVKAEDEEKNNLLEIFDLLVDKIKSEVSVEKKERYRTVVSNDMFEKMKSELFRKRI